MEKSFHKFTLNIIVLFAKSAFFRASRVIHVRFKKCGALGKGHVKI